MTYVIGEIGQNHNGSVDLGKVLIDVASRPVRDDLFGLDHKPMDAVKFTKRDLKEELSASQMSRPYDSPHSFGRTYGEHRARLELSDEQHFELYKYTKDKGLDFVETLCARGCLTLLRLFTPDRLKVASRDLTNIPLLEAMAETEIPIILSTGMGGVEELDQALEVISKYHSRISILHCLSEYPSQYHNINLKTLLFLQRRYPEYTIGYSDHSIGISIPLAAVAMGARIIEKHITIDRKMKGTDQAGSLGMDGIWRMMRDIRNLELAVGEETMYRSEAALQTSLKLERSIASNKDLPAGHILSEDDFHLLSPGDGVKWKDRSQLVGRMLKKSLGKDEIIYFDLIE